MNASAKSGPLGVGIIGTGVISQTYLENLTTFPDVAVVAVGDLMPERAQAKAEEFGIPSWGTADDVLANPDVDLVVNLTIPAVHVEVSRVDSRSRPRVCASGRRPTRSSARGSRPPSAPSKTA